MTSGGTHRELREALGAYALAVLPPGDRAAVEAHLAGCATCRDRLASLAPLPGLLARFDPDEAARVAASARPAAGVEALVARLRRRQRRALRRWRWATGAAAAAAAVLATLVALPTPDVEAPPVLPIVVVAPAAVGAQGTASTLAWDWGTTVQLDLSGLPEAERFEVVVVTVDGVRELVGSWSGTATGAVRWRGGTAVAASNVARIEVTDREGRTLLAAETGET